MNGKNTPGAGWQDTLPKAPRRYLSLELLAATALAVILLLPSCLRKEQDQQDPDIGSFRCIALTDLNGAPYGLLGDACADGPGWGRATLNSTERGFLTFPDTVSLVGTQATPISDVALWPNPGAVGASWQLLLLGVDPGRLVRLSVALVNESLQVLLRRQWEGPADLPLALQIPPDMAPGTHYRLYYRVEYQGMSAPFEGYGNVLVCRPDFSPGLTPLPEGCQ
jgi:hypothetical protein